MRWFMANLPPFFPDRAAFHLGYCSRRHFICWRLIRIVMALATTAATKSNVAALRSFIPLLLPQSPFIRHRIEYGRWVRDVLVWTKAPLMLRQDLVPVDRLAGNIRRRTAM
jgi:hypothetical protein